MLLLGNELVCSENRAVQRKHKNGTRFIVHRANSGTQYAEVDERGEEFERKLLDVIEAGILQQQVHCSRELLVLRFRA